ncbi:hypothetical protein, variant [Thecamonas trahens ATCC 50062]|nr:hypothetical protein, variant [Thecamonas trahens ATCC 50062]KNC46264.1 hypothetical protein, variant [Thecamonas trahens ATCC 50062]|eukprot:XP_013760558.1 hypothetical protein, variant [Thecamonas trahens ATCC 50062]
MTPALEDAHVKAKSASKTLLRNLHTAMGGSSPIASPGTPSSPYIGGSRPGSEGGLRTVRAASASAPMKRNKTPSLPQLGAAKKRMHAQTALAGSLSSAQKELLEEEAMSAASQWLAAGASHESRRESRLRRGHAKIDIQVLFVFGEGDVTHEVEVRDVATTLTVGEAKERAISVLRATGQGLDNDFSESRMFSVGSSAANEEPMTLRSLAAVRNAIVRARKLDTKAVVRFFVLRKELIRKEKFATMQIGSLIGIPLQFFDGANDEVSSFRGNMKRLRSQLAGASRMVSEAVVPNLKSSPAPPDFPAELIFRLRFSDDVVKTGKVLSSLTPTQALATVFDKFAANLAVLLQAPAESFVAEAYTLKVPGEWDFLLGDAPLCDYEYIRSAGAAKGAFIPINVVERSTVPELVATPLTHIEPHFPAAEHQVAHFEHSNIAFSETAHPDSAAPFISLWDVDDVVKVQVVGLDAIKPSLVSWHWGKEHRKPKVEGVAAAMFVEVGLFHGQEQLCPPTYSQVIEAHEWSNNCPRFYETLALTTKLALLPKAARLCVTVWGQKKVSHDLSPESDNNYALGWTSLQLVDFRNQLVAGKHSFKLWEFDPANPIGPTSDNPASDAPTLHLAFPRRMHPVVFPEFPVLAPLDLSAAESVPPEEAVVINAVIARDPLAEITPGEKDLLWKARYTLVHTPEALPKFLLSVKWDDPSQVQEVHRLLDVWAPLDPVDSLELLDANYFDAKVRSFAIECLNSISDEMLEDFLLQLVQVLKYEPHHESELARFLLVRALQNRRIGHSFFWILKSEVEEPDVTVRFSLLLEAYLRGCGRHRDELIKQNDLLVQLVRAAEAIKEVKGPMRMDVLQDHLRRMTFGDGRVQILLNPKWSVSGLKLDKCKYMDSKKLPLWLVFENEDESGDDLYVIFKAGDDLRQDKLTLQLFSIMDKVWENDGLPVRLEPYSCMATGPSLGMIQVVRWSNTIANIQQDYGGSAAAFKDEPLAEWLKGKCKDEAAYAEAVKTFTISCAAYCVATYVLGIGDRHNDNIMLSEKGRLFHIDFGHFLGNIKRKLGIKRERAPFVFTPDMVYVMGGKESPHFAEFVEVACDAFVSLRRKANLIINLMMLMVSTGIPELRSISDLAHLRTSLALDAESEAAAREEFRGLIFQSLQKGWATMMNFFFHNLKHK